MKRLLLVAIASLLAGIRPLPAEPSYRDDPGPGVARISLIRGDVSVRRGDSGDWVAAAVNAPLVAADAVLTGSGSRAEIQLDRATFLRLAPNTEIRLDELELDRYRVELVQGTVTLSLLRDTRAQVDISTPNVSIRPAGRGLYRISLRPDEVTEITARQGDLEVYGPRGTEWVREGRTMVVRGPASDPEFQLTRAVPRDDWDRWNEERNRQLRRVVSYRYVGPAIYGVEELDLYGRWVYVPPYGWVWAPHVAIAWAPYRYGRWCWIDWFGWTWVSYEPWGWAPYHWGRWFYHPPYGWLWWPGVVHVHYYEPWRPALVAFVGWDSLTGVHFGFGFGFARIGWIPLAPWEPYRPWYRWHRGPDGRRVVYVDNSVNIVNNINIVNVYRNARYRDAITIVDTSDFLRGRVRQLSLDHPESLAQARLVQGILPVVPTRETLRFADRELQPDRLPPSRLEQRPPSPRVQRISFAEQVREIQQVARAAWPAGNPRAAEPPSQVGSRWAVAGGREDPAPSGGRVERGIPPEQPSFPLPRTGDPRLSLRTRDGAVVPRGWRTVDTPEMGSQTGSAAPRETSPARRVVETTGWRRFGEPQATPQSEPSGVASRESQTPANPRAGSRPSRFSTANPTTGDSRDLQGGWRRFGEPLATPNRQGDTAGSANLDEQSRPVIRPSGGSPWRRFDSSERDRVNLEATPPALGPGDLSRPEPRRPATQSRPSGRDERPSRITPGPDPARNPIRLSPPIVAPRRAEPPEERFGRRSDPAWAGEPAWRPRSAPQAAESPRFERRWPTGPMYEPAGPSTAPTHAPSGRTAPSVSPDSSWGAPNRGASPGYSRGHGARSRGGQR